MFEPYAGLIGGSFDGKLLILDAVPFVLEATPPDGRLPLATFTGLGDTVLVRLGIAFTEESV